MKIRADFVTNSSSSSFVTVGILSKELSDFLKKYTEAEYKDTIFCLNSVGELHLNGDVVNFDGVTYAGNSIANLYINNLMDEDDTRTAKQVESDNRRLGSDLNYVLSLILSCLPKLAESEGKELYRILSQAFKEKNIASRTYVAMTDSIRDCDLFTKAEILGKKVNIDYNSNDFNIKDGQLTKYKGKASIVDIPNGVVTLSDHSLSKACIKTINIPKSVLQIDDEFNCENLESINVDPDNENYSSIDGVLYNKSQTELIRVPSNYPKETFTTPQSVISIKSRALYYCKKLTEITLSENVRTIEYFAFTGCDNIRKLSVLNAELKNSENLPMINLFGKDIYDYEKEIGISHNDLFVWSKDSECVNIDCEYARIYNVSEITVPFNAKMFGYAYYGRTYGRNYEDKHYLNYEIQVPSVKRFIVSNDDTELDPDWNYARIKRFNEIFVNVEQVKLPSNITEIPEKLFQGLSQLKTVNPLNKLEFIRANAFEGTSLEEITIPSTIRSINKYAFLNCKKLKHIYIEEGATRFDETAFEGCDNAVIVCAENSYAHKYAKKNNIPFEINNSFAAPLEEKPLTPKTELLLLTAKLREDANGEKFSSVKEIAERFDYFNTESVTESISQVYGIEAETYFRMARLLK